MCSFFLHTFHVFKTTMLCVAEMLSLTASVRLLVFTMARYCKIMWQRRSIYDLIFKECVNKWK